MARRRSKTEYYRFGEYINPDITTHTSWEFGNDLIEYPAPIRFKNIRGVYKFLKVGENTRTGRVWVDCFDANGQFRSFEASLLKGIVKPKRKRRKRIV